MHAQLRSVGNRYSGMVDEMVASHTVDKGHLGTHLCGGQIPVRLWVGWQVSLKLTSLMRLALPSSCCWVNCPTTLQQLLNHVVYAVLLLLSWVVLLWPLGGTCVIVQR